MDSLVVLIQSEKKNDNKLTWPCRLGILLKDPKLIESLGLLGTEAFFKVEGDRLGRCVEYVCSGPLLT